MRYHQTLLTGIMTMAWFCVISNAQAGPTFIEVDQGDGCVVIAQLAWMKDTEKACVSFITAQVICDYKASFGHVRTPIYQSTLPQELAAAGLSPGTIAYGGFTPDSSSTYLKPTTVIPNIVLDESEYWLSRGRLYNLSALAVNPTTEEETIIRPLDNLHL
jgi:hypothetical protein